MLQFLTVVSITSNSMCRCSKFYMGNPLNITDSSESDSSESDSNESDLNESDLKEPNLKKFDSKKSSFLKVILENVKTDDKDTGELDFNLKNVVETSRFQLPQR